MQSLCYLTIKMKYSPSLTLCLCFAFLSLDLSLSTKLVIKGRLTSHFGYYFLVLSLSLSLDLSFSPLSCWQRHVQAKLVIPPVAPAAVALAQLGLLQQTGHGHHQGTGEELMRITCDTKHMLHLGNHLIRLTVLVLVMYSTVRQKEKKSISIGIHILVPCTCTHHSPMWKTRGPFTIMACSFLCRHCCDTCCSDQSQL